MRYHGKRHVVYDSSSQNTPASSCSYDVESVPIQNKKHSKKRTAEYTSIKAYKNSLKPTSNASSSLSLNTSWQASSKSSTNTTLARRQTHSNDKYHDRTSSLSKSVEVEYQTIKTKALRAVNLGKVFSLRGYDAVRKHLHARGWVEKLETFSLQTKEEKNLFHKNLGELKRLLGTLRNPKALEKVLTSKIIGAVQADFCWANTDQVFNFYFRQKGKETIVNFLPYKNCCFTSKISLAQAAKSDYFDNHPYSAYNFNHPRSFILSHEDRNGEMQDFVQNYRITSCVSLLQWIVQTYQNKESKLITSGGKVPLKAFYFALDQCQNFISNPWSCGDDLYSRSIWDDFFEWYYKVVHVGNHFKDEGTLTEENMVSQAQETLFLLKKLWPHLEVDGVMNAWMLKPLGGTKGKGILMCCFLKIILESLEANSDVTYVAQKYIERPLLIYNTKFDIRQWFLISSVSPLTIWIYREFYLRFSSRTYNTHKMHEAIHLTNNAIQAKCEAGKDLVLPDYHMWHNKQFKSFLANVGYPGAYDRICNGMYESITAVVVRFLHNFNHRKNCFQLYGADFLISKDFTPFLIEINWYPDMSKTTPVTATMTDECFRDLFKVILDYSQDPSASTGKFDILYQEHKEKNFPLPREKMKIEKIVKVQNFQTGSTEPCKIAPLQKQEALNDSFSLIDDRKNIFFGDDDILNDVMLNLEKKSITLDQNQKIQLKGAYGNIIDNIGRQKLEDEIEKIIQSILHDSQSLIYSKLQSKFFLPNEKPKNHPRQKYEDFKNRLNTKKHKYDDESRISELIGIKIDQYYQNKGINTSSLNMPKVPMVPVKKTASIAAKTDNSPPPLKMHSASVRADIKAPPLKTTGTKSQRKSSLNIVKTKKAPSNVKQIINKIKNRTSTPKFRNEKTITTLQEPDMASTSMNCNLDSKSQSTFKKKGQSGKKYQKNKIKENSEEILRSWEIYL